MLLTPQYDIDPASVTHDAAGNAVWCTPSDADYGGCYLLPPGSPKIVSYLDPYGRKWMQDSSGVWYRWIDDATTSVFEADPGSTA